MVTKEQALTAQEFHAGECSRTVGPRGGVKVRIEVWRRNGQTKLWKTRPDCFKVPIKHGLRAYATLHEVNEELFHVPEFCPLLEHSEATFSDERAILPIDTSDLPF